LVVPPWFSEFVISVAAMDKGGGVADFSIQGPWVSMAAPGTEIIHELQLSVGTGVPVGRRWIARFSVLGRSTARTDAVPASGTAPHPSGSHGIRQQRQRSTPPHRGSVLPIAMAATIPMIAIPTMITTGIPRARIDCLSRSSIQPRGSCGGVPVE
jgi:hypothetical protein